MTAQLLVVREQRLPLGNTLLCAVRSLAGLDPAVLLGVCRDGEVKRQVLLHRDCFEAAEQAIAAHRRREAFLAEVPDRNATLRIDASRRGITISRHRDGVQLGAAREVRADEVDALEEALRICSAVNHEFTNWRSQ